MLKHGDQPGNELENALWMALRTLEKKAALARRMAEKALRADMTSLAGTYDSRAQEATRRSDVVRQALLREEPDATRLVAPRRRSSRKAARKAR